MKTGIAFLQSRKHWHSLTDTRKVYHFWTLIFVVKFSTKNLNYISRNRNCLIQCLIDRIMNNCGCVAYYFPSSDEINICGTDQYTCSYNSRKVGKIFKSSYNVAWIHFLNWLCGGLENISEKKNHLTATTLLDTSN